MEKNLALPALRKICGLTQARLASKIGVSTRTIVAVENGTRPLTEENAHKIKYATGVHPQSLLREDLPRALHGKPYQKAHWEAWKSTTVPDSEAGRQMTRSIADDCNERFIALLRAAAGSGRIFLFADEFRGMLRRLLEDPVIRGRYSKEMPEDDSKEFGNLMEDSLVLSFWELEEVDESDEPG